MRPRRARPSVWVSSKPNAEGVTDSDYNSLGVLSVLCVQAKVKL
jgi:hypothetical protein